MARFIVRGNIAISFEKEVEGDYADAFDAAYDIAIKTSFDGQSVFVDDNDTVIDVDGDAFNVEVECIEEDDD